MNKIISMVLTCLFSASVLQAQISTERVGVYGAGSFIGANRTFVTRNDDLFQTTFRKGGKIGVRFSADINDQWAGEGSYSFGRNSLQVAKQDPPRRTTIFPTFVHQFAGNGSYFFAPAGDEFRPFLTVGLSITRFSPTDEATIRAAQDFLGESTRISPSTKLGINFGGGFEAVANNWFGIRVDAKDHVMGIPRFGIPETPLNPGGVFYPVSGASHNLEVAVGVLFYLR